MAAARIPWPARRLACSFLASCHYAIGSHAPAECPRNGDDIVIYTGYILATFCSLRVSTTLTVYSILNKNINNM